MKPFWMLPLQMYERIRMELEGGGRAYIICPLVEASKAATLEDVKAAEDEHARLVAGADLGVCSCCCLSCSILNTFSCPATPCVLRTVMPQLMWLCMCKLAEGQLGSAKIGLLHGRLAPEEKIAALDAFSSGETPVLISTTVVEVRAPAPDSLYGPHCPHVLDSVQHDIHRAQPTGTMSS
jgi:ATP-dependent DNA helicase RecG